MTFLVLAPGAKGSIDPGQLQEVARGRPIVWFSPANPSRGGAISLSPLASVARLKRKESCESVLVGRVRLDRRNELKELLSAELPSDAGSASDADLCLYAYERWGARFIDQLHGDFAFALIDNAKGEMICARDRLGIRALAWSQGPHGFWVSDSIDELVNSPNFSASTLDAHWISSFLRVGVCDDTTRSVYAAVKRIPPAHILTLRAGRVLTTRYWTLSVEAPIQLGSPDAYLEAFHHHLDLAMRDRLPPDRIGILMSGGLDSSTLAAKAIKLGGGKLNVSARTWLVGGDTDPESAASTIVAEFLGLEHTFVNADRLRFDPHWQDRPATTPEPSFEMLESVERVRDTQEMRSQSAYWLYGEGPDNALTFEWRMHLRWLLRHRAWGRLPGVVAAYLASKSLADWRSSLQSMIRQNQDRAETALREPSWIKGEISAEQFAPQKGWRPRAHQSFSFPLWPAMFEGLDNAANQVGIEWRHPYMDLRVLEFLLATPPIPWARHKLLLRKAMQGQLPDSTLRRRKAGLHLDFLAQALYQNLPEMPRRGSQIEEFVNLANLPDDPATYSDVYALARVAILQHWLATRHG